MNDKVTIRDGEWPEDAASLQRIRKAVFIDEQGVPADIEWDGRDDECIHVIAQADDTDIGCGRMLPDGRIGRLAVLHKYRRQGVGVLLLQRLLSRARHDGRPSVYLHAQADAVAFYLQAGFTVRGEPFDEAGIQHLDMQQPFDYRRHDEPISRVHAPHPFADLAVAQAHFSRRELRILSPSLDYRCFDNDALRSEILQLIRDNRRASVQIIVNDVRPMVQRGHRLLELARRMPSGLQIRHLPEHPNWSGDTVLIRDRDGLLTRPVAEKAQGVYQPKARASAATAIERFSELWHAATEHPELRSLSL